MPQSRMQPRPDPAHRALADYARRWPDELGMANQFIALLAPSEGAFLRTRRAGHFTGSAWLVDAGGSRVLLTHHRKLDRWLQLGGHADGDRDLAQVALREAEEESGLAGLTVERDIFDLDRHWIPTRADEPAHWHYDVRHVVRAGADERFMVSHESHALAWCDIAAIAADPPDGGVRADASLRRMADKWRQRAIR